MLYEYIKEIGVYEEMLAEDDEIDSVNSPIVHGEEINIENSPVVQHGENSEMVSTSTDEVLADNSTKTPNF